LRRRVDGYQCLEESRYFHYHIRAVKIVHSTTRKMEAAGSLATLTGLLVHKNWRRHVSQGRNQYMMMQWCRSTGT